MLALPLAVCAWFSTVALFWVSLYTVNIPSLSCHPTEGSSLTSVIDSLKRHTIASTSFVHKDLY